MVPFGIRGGRVSAFDEDRGLGSVTAEDGSELAFHCTAIAGGSRTIAVGTAVVFETVAGAAGTWWAASLTPR